MTVGAFVLGLAAFVTGVVFVMLGATGGAKVTLFGQQLSTTSVGIAAIHRIRKVSEVDLRFCALPVARWEAGCPAWSSIFVAMTHLTSLERKCPPAGISAAVSR